jgi:hypothetical protein
LIPLRAAVNNLSRCEGHFRALAVTRPHGFFLAAFAGNRRPWEVAGQKCDSSLINGPSICCGVAALPLAARR